SFRILSVVDEKVGRPAETSRVPPQHARADRVEGADPHPRGFPPEQCTDPLAHLPRCLVGEGQRQNRVGRNAELLDQMGDSGGEYRGLTGACAGKDQKCPLEVAGGERLFGIETVQIRQDCGQIWVVDVVVCGSSTSSLSASSSAGRVAMNRAPRSVGASISL